MQTSSPASHRDLGHGLILRWSTQADTEHIAELVGTVFREKESDPPNEFLTRQVRLLMHGDHPNMTPYDYAVVEDTQKEGNPIVACTALWRHTWQYEGITLRIGRPEIVASHPAYRHRGLIRALFALVHERSESEGHLVQAITGIPYFYRQFGYAYALDLGGNRTTYLPLIPRLKEGESEPYTMRKATVEDIPSIMQCYENRRSESILWKYISKEEWYYDIAGWQQHPELGEGGYTHVIVDQQGVIKGVLSTINKRWGTRLPVWMLEFAPKVNIQSIVPSLLRHLQAHGLQIPTQREDTEPLTSIDFQLGARHPIYEVLGNSLAPYQEQPYAWYIRVVDIPAFLQHIAPALEQRLEHSFLHGYSSEIKIDFYRKSGLRLVFENGRLTTSQPWTVPVYDAKTDAGLPALVFLQLVFGYRSFSDLRYAYPEVWAKHETEVAFNVLFPHRPSYLFG